MTDNTRARLESICRQLTKRPAEQEIADDMPLGEVPGGLMLDSLDLLELRLFAEDDFCIEIRDTDIDNPETGTFGGMLTLIERKRAALTIGACHD